MRNALLAITLLPLLIAACGVGVSQSRDGETIDAGPNPHPTPQEAGSGPDANACSSNPDIQCLDCNGNTVWAECVNGVYECPTYNCPVQVPDAGGCNYPYDCPAFCGIVCENDQWTCVCDEDGGWHFDAQTWDVNAPDVAVPDGNVYDGGGNYFACGPYQYCDSALTYCQVTTGGPEIDGGATGYECIALPNTCAPGAASCECVQALQGIGCACADFASEITVTCAVP
jgi:hypothetical protein